MSQKFATRPSQVLGIKDEAVALDFDIAAAIKLQEWETEQQQGLAALIASNIAALLAGGEPLIEVQTARP